MFVLKKLVSRLLFPVPVCALLFLLGMLLDWRLNRRRLGRGLMLAGLVVLVALASQPVASALVGAFEDAYRPLGTADALPDYARDVRYVVILTGGDRFDPDVPLTRQMDSHSLMRLVEGARIYALLDDARIVLSGGYGAESDVPDAELSNHAMVRQLGVPEEDILVVNCSRDTAEEARNVAAVIGAEPFILVASASHMPRATLLFQAQGLDPIPAPTDYYVGLRRQAIVEDVYPGAGYLMQSERAVYEALGTAWAKLSGAAQ